MTGHTTQHPAAPQEDFLSFLQERRALDAAEAFSLLSAWLTSYEPSAEALSRARAAGRSDGSETPVAPPFAA
jgi:hypothetical protein